MRGIPYLMEFLELGNEAHLRPSPKNLRALKKIKKEKNLNWSATSFENDNKFFGQGLKCA